MLTRLWCLVFGHRLETLRVRPSKWYQGTPEAVCARFCGARWELRPTLDDHPRWVRL